MVDMPVSFTPINNGKKWTGAAWVVACDETLALHIAKVALGQARHVARILREIGTAGSFKLFPGSPLTNSPPVT